MKKQIKEYFVTLKKMLDGILSTDLHGKAYEFHEAIDTSVRMIDEASDSAQKIMLIGNGASASIASHVATDFWKNAGVRARAFNDSSSLTCISNDYGYKHVFEKPIEMFAECNDILIAISSSGTSENILRGVNVAKEKSIKIITLSGFKKNNPLKKMGHINFFVPSLSYGHVEAIHHTICHCLVDMIIKKRKSGQA